MEILRNITEALKFRSGLSASQSVGLVPTMGALHKGHQTLIEKARSENDHTFVSVFVNPTQFNDVSDFEAYPRTEEEDLNLLRRLGCSAVFIPEASEMYREPPSLRMDFGPLESIMEGAHRPGHFNGVGIVVSKLFNLTTPHRAYFGEKDLQQVIIIEKMVQSLSFPISIVRCPTLRDEEGLALSSRNRRLSDAGIQKARKINKILEETVLQLKQLRNTLTSMEAAKSRFLQEGIQLEYLELGLDYDLGPVRQLSQGEVYALCVACFVEGVRLIDNKTFHL